jgi:hypothetical protein
VEGDEEMRGGRGEGEIVDEIANFAGEVEEGCWHVGCQEDLEPRCS